MSDPRRANDEAKDQSLPPEMGEDTAPSGEMVPAEQVKAVAGKYFGDDQLTVGVLRPQPLDPNRKPRTPASGARHAQGPQ